MRRPSAATVTVLGVTAALVGVNAWWYSGHRRGFPLTSAETAYLNVATDFTIALDSRGVGGLIDAVRDQPVFAPLVPLATVPAQSVIGGTGPGFGVLLGFYALLVLATYALGRHETTSWVAVLGALVVATTPGAIRYARLYFFAVPAAALFVVALYCFVRADGLRRWPWAVAGGATLGLVALSRTMMLGLVPGPLLAALAQALAAPGALRRRLAALAAAVAAGVAVAAVWYARSLSDVVSYLSGDERFRAGGEGDPGLAPVARDLHQLIQVLYLPLALVLVAVVLSSVARRRRARHGTSLRRFLRTDTGFLTVVLVEGIAVLAVAKEARGAWVPLVPVIVVLALAPLASLDARRSAAVAAVLVAVCVVNTAMLTDVAPAVARRRNIGAGPLGHLTIVDGRQEIQVELAKRGHDTGRPGRLPDRFRAWRPLHDDLAAWMVEFAAARGETPVLAMSARDFDPLLGPGDLRLAHLLATDRPVLVPRVLRDEGPSLADGYRRQLSRSLSANFVVTLDPDARRGTERLRALEHAVRAERFDLVRRVELPDGREARVWWRPLASPASKGQSGTG